MKNTFQTPVLAIVLALVGLAGYGIQSGFIRIPASPTTIAAAEDGYTLALTAMQTYEHACYGYTDKRGVHHVHVLSSDCVLIYKKMISAEKVAGAAYTQIRGHELEADPQVASAFFAAVVAFKSSAGVTP